MFGKKTAGKYFKIQLLLEPIAKRFSLLIAIIFKSAKEKQLLQQQCKENKSDNFFNCKVGRAITKLGAKVNRPILILQY